MKTRLRGTLLRVGAACALSGLAVAGCGSSQAAAYCDQVCDCEGCSDSARHDCVTVTKAAESDAEDRSCGGSFRDALSCAVGSAECLEGSFAAYACLEAIDGYEKCMGNSGYLRIAGNACKVYAQDMTAKLDECGAEGSGDPDSTTECNASLAEQANCLDACLPRFDCGCFNDPTGDGCLHPG